MVCFPLVIKKAASLTILVLSIIFFTGCEKYDWHRANRQNTIPAYEHFMKTHSNSALLINARNNMQVLRFEEVKKLNSIPAFESFLRTYIWGELADSVRFYMERLAFEKAQNTNTLPALYEFFDYYNPFWYADSARKSLNRLYSQRHADFQHVKTARVIINRSFGSLNDFIDLPFEEMTREVLNSYGIQTIIDDEGQSDMLFTVRVDGTIIQKEQPAPDDSLSAFGISFTMLFTAHVPGKEPITLHAESRYFPEQQHTSIASRPVFESAFWQTGSFPSGLATLTRQCFGPSGLIALLHRADMRPHIIHALVDADASTSDMFYANLKEINEKSLAIASILCRRNDANVKPFLVDVLRSQQSDAHMQAMTLLQCMPDTAGIAPLIHLTEQRLNRKRCMRAIETLGYIQHETSLAHLAHLLQDRDEGIREQAVLALRHQKDPAVINMLITMLADEDRNIANQAMASLTQLGDSAVDSLIQALHSDDTGTVWRAMVILGELRVEHAVKDIIPLLNHSNSFTSWRAREILGQFKNDTVFQDMLRVLNDPEMTEKAAAVLGYLGDTRAVQPLITSYQGEKNLQAQIAIIRALGKLRDPLATDVLIDVLNSDQIVLQAEAAKALGHIGDANALPVLAQWYQKDDIMLKRSILEAYGNYQHPKQTQRLIQALQEDDVELREKAVEMLGGLGEKESIPDLVYLLYDSSPRVQDAAKNALAHFGDAAIPYMNNIMQRQIERNLRIRIVYALKDTKSEHAVSALINLLDDADTYFVTNVKVALQQLGEPAVVPLLNMLKTGNSMQRSRAAEVLSSMKEPRAVAEFVKILNSSNNELKTSVASLMGDLNYYPAVPLLLTCLDKKETTLAIEATIALGKIGSAEATPALITGLQSSNVTLVIESARALGRIKDDRAIPGLIEKSTSRNEQIKKTASQALVNFGALAVEPLIALMTDANHYTIQNTAHILAQIGEPSVSALLPLIHDTSTTSWYAVEALGKIKDPRAIQPLIDSLTLDDEYFYRTVKSALATIGEPAYEPVVSLLQSKNPDQRWKAVEIMYAFKEPSMLNHFIAALEDNEWRVRFAATKVLQSISGKSYEPNLKKWRRWYNERKDQWNI